MTEGADGGGVSAPFLHWMKGEAALYLQPQGLAVQRLGPDLQADLGNQTQSAEASCQQLAVFAAQHRLCRINAEPALLTQAVDYFAPQQVFAHRSCPGAAWAG